MLDREQKYAVVFLNSARILEYVMRSYFKKYLI